MLILIWNSKACMDTPDKIQDLKYFDHELYQFPCMYSGFVNVDEETDSNMFYWLYTVEDENPDAPFLIYLNGGPGASSQLANFLIAGPLKIIRDENGEMHVVVREDGSWAQISNILFLDQPIGTGYSYGHLKVDGHREMRKYVLKFIKGFYEIHPEMKTKDFYVTGESYGGVLEPHIASEIIDYNKQASDEDKIPLKGVTIGNGFVDVAFQRINIKQIPLALGLVQSDSIPQVEALERNCTAETGSHLKSAYDSCAAIWRYFKDMDGGVYRYNVEDTSKDMKNKLNDIEELLNDPEVVEQVHTQACFDANNSYSIMNFTVRDNYWEDVMNGSIAEHQYILDNDIPMLLYIGNMDQLDGPYGVQKWMQKLEWEYMPEFHSSSRQLYYYTDLDGKMKVGGNFKQYKNLHFIIIYEGGHLLPRKQMTVSKRMMSDFIEHKELQCHHPDNKCSLDEIT